MYFGSTSSVLMSEFSSQKIDLKGKLTFCVAVVKSFKKMDNPVTVKKSPLFLFV